MRCDCGVDNLHPDNQHVTYPQNLCLQLRKLKAYDVARHVSRCRAGSTVLKQCACLGGIRLCEVSNAQAKLSYKPAFWGLACCS